VIRVFFSPPIGGISIEGRHGPLFRIG